MTLLTTVQNAAEAIGLKRPSSVASSTSDTARSLKRFAINTAEELLREHDWSILTKEHEITADGSSSYALPSDLDRIIPDTAWNEDDNWRQRGSQTAAQWARRNNSWEFSSTLNAAYFIQQNGLVKNVYIDPAPASGETWSFYYISTDWVNNGSTLQSAWDTDSYTSVIPEYLIEKGVIWKMLRRLGRDFQSEQREYIAERDRFFAQDAPQPVIDLRGNGVLLGAITPETGIG